MVRVPSPLGGGAADALGLGAGRRLVAVGGLVVVAAAGGEHQRRGREDRGGAPSAGWANQLSLRDEVGAASRLAGSSATVLAERT